MLITLPADDTEFAAALTYLPVAVRAADRNPRNDILWAESVRAQRAVIEYADAHMSNTDAAEVQNQVGRIAHFAIVTGATEYGRGPAITYSERAKARVLALLADQRAAHQ
jgi:hypothetical protein